MRFSGDISNTTGAPATITTTFRLIVANVAAANHGETKVNTVTVTYLDADNNVETKTASVPITLTEPLLIIEKTVSPTSVLRGSTLLYEITLYHSPTSTVPAYNVVITDLIPAGLQYISNSWDQTAGPTADAPPLAGHRHSFDCSAGWSVIPPSVTQANPIRLRFNLVVPPDVVPPAPYTNFVTTTWTSLANDPYGETRNGGGGE